MVSFGTNGGLTTLNMPFIVCTETFVWKLFNEHKEYLDYKVKIFSGHKIDNTSIFPGAGYLSVVLDMIAETLVKINVVNFWLNVAKWQK